ncbi:MAG TPA: aminoglycoside phosphotransferase family protein [Tessaracoccus flavescens]|uniref:Aminoglycoside phosphotransferase family protein n=1 Tax=Tessaracoccus flavescens TaxID=399497 RepID=A0A921JRZ7_9ACTN|nr:aminoglycoside phosphotransferase family protein [Tessaracoccus flavescens]
MPVQIPTAFAGRLRGRPADEVGGIDGDTWLERLPQAVAGYLDEWELRPDGAPWFGENALVVPVRRRTGVKAALKLTWPHAEARHEPLALRLWAGRGAVELLAADPSAYVVLLERLDGDRDLTTVPILEACEEIGWLFTTLDQPAPPQVDRVDVKAKRWRRQLAAHPVSVPRRLCDQARSTLDGLLDDAPAPRLVHEDLHDMNVLAPLDDRRGRWVAIDPKPVAGEWAYAVAPIVWNRADAASAAHNFRTHVRLRAEVVADAAQLDPDRVQEWTFVRLVLNALWAAEYGRPADGFRGRMIALAKAFSDPFG